MQHTLCIDPQDWISGWEKVSCDLLTWPGVGQPLVIDKAIFVGREGGRLARLGLPQLRIIYLPKRPLWLKDGFRHEVDNVISLRIQRLNYVVVVEHLNIVVFRLLCQSILSHAAASIQCTLSRTFAHRCIC